MGLDSVDCVIIFGFLLILIGLPILIYFDRRRNDD